MGVCASVGVWWQCGCVVAVWVCGASVGVCVPIFNVCSCSTQTSSQKKTLLNWFSKSPRPTSDHTPLTKKPKLQQ